MTRVLDVDHAAVLKLLRDFPGQRRAQRVAARAEDYQQRHSAAENSPKTVEIARRLIEFCLDLWRALEFTLAIDRRTRAELAVVAQNLLVPGVVRRLVLEVREHRVDAVENAPALQRPFDKRIAPSEFGSLRRLENYR